MRVDRSQNGEYASPKRIRITHDVHVESLFLFSMILVNTHHDSCITRMWSRGFTRENNMAVTESDLDLKVRKMSITF